MGHLSRCRGLIEFLSEKKEYSLEIFGADNFGEPPSGWIITPNCLISNGGLEDALKIPALMADTYDSIIQRKISERNHGRAVLITDGNSKSASNSPNLFQIKLEVFKEFPRQEKKDSLLKTNEIAGTLFWSSKLEEVLSDRARLNSRSFGSRKNIVVSFGASDKTLSVLEKTIVSLERITKLGIANIEIFCSKSVQKGLSEKSKVKPGIMIQEFDESFYNKIKLCDLLICGSGTTSIEAYHLAIPSIVVKLFDNAKHNFDNLKEIFLGAEFIDINHKNFVDEIYTLILRQLKSEQREIPNKTGVVDSNRLEEVFEFVTNSYSSQP